MTYVPNNTPVYLRAFSGFMSGITASVSTDPNPADYSLYAQMADAYAQEVDTVFGVSAPTLLELDEIDGGSESYWEERSPLPTSIATIAGSYNGIALAIIARAKQGNAQVVAEGIDPNGTGTPGSGTVTSVTATAPLKVTGGATTTPNVAASAFTAGVSGLAHVTAGVMDAAPALGTEAGKVATTNAAGTDVVFDWVFKVWTADVLPAASPFTPTADQMMVAVNTSTGAVTVKTPLAQDGVSLPQNGQMFCVKPTAASATPITLSANGAGVTVEDPSNAGNFGATGHVPGQGSGAWFKFRSVDNKWIAMPGGF